MLVYADDTVLYFSHKSIKEIQNQLEKDFISLAEWLKINELIINTKKGKTEIMIFGTSKRLSKLNDKPIQIVHNYSVINITKSYKYLGLSLSPNLNMYDHLHKSVKKFSSRVHLLRKMRSFMDIDTALMVYQAMISPLLTYCSFSVYGATLPYIQQKIERLESRAEKLVGRKVPKRDHIIKKKICTYVHKCLNDKNVCDSFKNYFKIKNSKINTRSNGTMLTIPKVKLEIAKSSFYYQGTKIFNSLPKNLRIEKDLKSFKTKIKNL